MSDLSPLEQSFGLMPQGLPPDCYEPPPLVTELQPEDVAFRRLRGASEISRITHLRREIALPAAALGDPGFAAREKKETRSVWSAPSCATGNTSARSACCR
ncbi:hypothetical protein [Ramlibacter pallidus]|uniref:Uncharacterized protein n=1 Tax=Ramlibacter pallidus TaxID=2780087 RepID=A0ABR9S410_9BURK|nr:hypothetical protein [Ramlibacter pallidus]MBE7368235.1 hypothetical protein [Ramlibacter pallidus]